MASDGSDIYGGDIFDEPEGSPDTLANLGPLAPLAGSWEGVAGSDVHPVAGGAEEQVYVERYDLVPIDRQTNGPQLLYGLRYHVHITKPGETETFHDQVGYWLWEPAARTVYMTLAIPRAQVLLASGPAEADDRSFTLTAELGSPVTGIASNPFLDTNYTTTAFTITVTTDADGTWSYDEVATLLVSDRSEPFEHRDHHRLHRVAPPELNPLAVQAAAAGAADGSLGIGSARPA